MVGTVDRGRVERAIAAADGEAACTVHGHYRAVTRRRRLTAPPVEADDQSTDPNTIAEYLDNVLPAEQLAEVEQASLDNDTRLAERAEVSPRQAREPIDLLSSRREVA